MKNIAVILSGCGVYDGSEIHEAVASLLEIEKQGARYEIYAPNISQYHVINHLTGSKTGESRNVLAESARIARGKITALNKFDAASHDGLLIVGGYGAAKNLSKTAFGTTTKESIDISLKQAVLAMRSEQKPIGALCISPIILAIINGEGNYTIGLDEPSARLVQQAGGTHCSTENAGEIIIDEQLNIVTGAAYMLNLNIVELFENVRLVVEALLARCKE